MQGAVDDECHGSVFLGREGLALETALSTWCHHDHSRFGTVIITTSFSNTDGIVVIGCVIAQQSSIVIGGQCHRPTKVRSFVVGGRRGAERGLRGSDEDDDEGGTVWYLFVELPSKDSYQKRRPRDVLDLVFGAVTGAAQICHFLVP